MKDPCIRHLIRETELLEYSGDRNSKIVEELNLPIAGARIDIAVINGSLNGYEIKSASDNLLRLPSQLEAYQKVFDYISIVTEERHLTNILENSPKEVGILLCNENEKSISRIREPKQNTSKESFYIAKLLWRNELIECLNKYHIKFKRKDRNWLLCETLASHLDIEIISLEVREMMKKRIDWKI